MKTMDELLKMIPQSQAQQSPQSDEMLLTEEEQQQAIQWAIQQEITRYKNSMKEKGERPERIEQKVLERNWIEFIDVPAVLQRSNFLKRIQIEQQQERQDRLNRAIEERERIMKEWNSERVYAKIKEYFIQKHGRFLIGESIGLIKVVCYLISGHQGYESELKYSFNKGLLVQGTAGLGKTETIRAVFDNPLRPVKIISILEIAEVVQETGQCNLFTDQLLLIDDVGSEPEVINHYGTKINWFKDFIELYYMKHQNFGNLIITTNLGGDEIEKRYGYRVRSRMREMFNSIQMTGEDLRGRI